MSGQPGQSQPVPIAPPQGVVTIGQTTFALTTGPIPPPEQLAAYDQIVPGAANRILTMAEHEQNGRLSILTAQVRQSARGQWMAFTLALCFLAASVWVTLAGSPIVGGVLGGTTVVGIVAMFITGQALQRPAQQRPPQQ
jgi:uncharacterized membrane protein